MRALLRPLAIPLLRRREGEIAERASRFAIRTESNRDFVDRLGRAFLGGYNAMLERRDMAEVAKEGAEHDPHFRPFWFEGAAMGYLPRAIFDPRFRPERAEQDLLRMDPAFRYLYYVGLGFWYAFRHRRRPESLLRLEAHVAPIYFPLCFDGYGFKLAFFDFADRPTAARAVLDRAPDAHRPAIYQGFGRGSFFVTLEDTAAFERIVAALPERHRTDLWIGRSLATGFTGIDRPQQLIEYVGHAPDADERAARLTGITWALAARKMNDRAYFDACLARVGPRSRTLLAELPDLCDRALEGATSYGDWQARTRAAAVERWAGQQPRLGV